jgi:hypothetical protein
MLKPMYASSARISVLLQDLQEVKSILRSVIKTIFNYGPLLNT